MSNPTPSAAHVAAAEVPTKPGYYWAKWRIPSAETHEGPLLTPSNKWEVVEVWPNSVDWDRDPTADEALCVSVPGVRETQHRDDFVWGELVAQLDEHPLARHFPSPPPDQEFAALAARAEDFRGESAGPLYPKQDHEELGDWYFIHLQAMTSEGLHLKSDIAGQLAWRDRECANLVAALGRERARADALQRFKQYVHDRLDAAGVPVDPESVHKAEGCRIGGRLDWVFARVKELETPQYYWDPASPENSSDDINYFGDDYAPAEVFQLESARECGPVYFRVVDDGGSNEYVEITKAEYDAAGAEGGGG